MPLILLASPLLVLGAALAGLATGRVVGDVVVTETDVRPWPWLVALVVLASLAVFTVVYTLPRAWAAGAALLAVGLTGARDVIGELTPWSS